MELDLFRVQTHTAVDGLVPGRNVGEQAGEGRRAGDGKDGGRPATSVGKGDGDAYEEAGDGSQAEGDRDGEGEVGECGRKWACFCGTFSRGELPGSVFGPR